MRKISCTIKKEMVCWLKKRRKKVKAKDMKKKFPGYKLMQYAAIIAHNTMGTYGGKL